MLREVNKKQYRRAPIHYCQGHSQGSVVSEFIITLPLLLLFFVGIFELGRLLNQVSWTLQTVYNSALYAAGVSDANNLVTNTESRAATLFQNSINQEIKTDPNDGPKALFAVETFQSTEPENAPAGWSASNNVKVSFHGALRELIPDELVPLSLNVYTVLPALVQPTSIVSDEFESRFHYCSDGVPSFEKPGGTCPPTAPLDPFCSRKSYCSIWLSGGNGSPIEPGGSGATGGGFVPVK